MKHVTHYNPILYEKLMKKLDEMYDETITDKLVHSLAAMAQRATIKKIKEWVEAEEKRSHLMLCGDTK